MESISRDILQAVCADQRAKGALTVEAITPEESFLVIESTPGYLPDADEPAEFYDYSEAVAYANELADELEEQGYTCDRSWASQDNLYAVMATRSDTVAPDLGRTIQVVRADS